MVGIRSFNHRGHSVRPGVTLTRAESETAATEKLPELRLRGTDSPTWTWMVSRGG